MLLDNNNHSVFSMHYHLVMVIKYRRSVLDEHISNRAKEIFMYIAPNYNITLLEWNHDGDHVHVLFKAHPNSALSTFINAYKSASSRLISCDSSEAVEGIFLVQKLLSVDNWRSTDRSHPGLHRKAG